MDEFALISSSKKISLDWFTSGYSDYFVVYPEWYHPFTDFLRPVANLTYWIFSPWSEIGFRLQLISVNYFVHAAIASTIFFASVCLFKNELLQSFLISLSVFFCAAFFNTPMPQYPTFALDAIAGFFCLCAILALVKRRDVLCVFFMVAALFTKESSLPIFGAMVLYGFYDKNFKRSFYVISILLVWASLRFYSYNGFGATPALSSGFDIQRLASLSLIPFGYFEVGQLKNIIILRDITLYNILYLVANIIFYFFLAKCTIRHFFIDAKRKVSQAVR